VCRSTLYTRHTCAKCADAMHVHRVSLDCVCTHTSTGWAKADTQESQSREEPSFGHGLEV
jgi:hypothetical protein